MPPYCPPIAHYTQVNVSHLNDTNVLKAMGANGYNFKKLTAKYRVKYVWWDKDRKVVEIWGPFHAMQNAFDGITEYMNKFTNLEDL
jgi:hypothetical protein